MKTARLRRMIKTYLSDKPRTTTEIKDYINSNYKHGTTSHVLGNILAKDSSFKKVGTAVISTHSQGVSHSYSVTVWGLSEL